MALAQDRAVADLATYAPEQIGRTRYRTPEGFLYCEGVRIARTGPMLYTSKEMPDIEVGPHTTMITVERGPEVLFAPDTILSFAGKPVTNDHPPEPVTPENFRQHSVGVVLNPRQGEGAEIIYLVADLLITDAEAIEAVDPPPGQKPKVEVSAGYELEVEQIKPGLARQTKNLGNHVALVERARGGPALSIQDHQQEEPPMATRTTRRILDGIRKAFKAKDEAALESELTKAEEAMDEEETGAGEAQTLVIKVEGAGGPAAAAEDDGEGEKEDPYEARFKSIEDTLTKIGDAFTALTAKDGDDDDKDDKEAKDGGDDDDKEDATDEEAKEEEKEADKASAQDAMSKAEILAPGIKLPAMDGLKNAGVTELRRNALRTAAADPARKAHVEAVMSGRKVSFDAMPAAQVAVVFDAAAAVARTAHNAGLARPGMIPAGRMTPAKLQELNRERRKTAS